MIYDNYDNYNFSYILTVFTTNLQLDSAGLGQLMNFVTEKHLPIYFGAWRMWNGRDILNV